MWASLWLEIEENVREKKLFEWLEREDESIVFSRRIFVLSIWRLGCKGPILLIIRSYLRTSLSNNLVLFEIEMEFVNRQVGVNFLTARLKSLVRLEAICSRLADIKLESIGKL